MINVLEIQRRMQSLNITPGSLGRELGISERCARLVVYGRTVPTWEHLVRMANLFGCKPRDLIVSEREDTNA